METISSRRNSIVEMFKGLTDRRATNRRILLDGPHLLEEARAAGLPVQVAAFATRLLKSSDSAIGRLASQVEQAGARVVQVTDSVMDAISPVRTPSGVTAIAERPLARIDDLFSRPPELIVIAVNVQDPGNLGAIIRAADAGGATGLIVCGASADPFGWKALRGAMGSAFRVPLVEQHDPAEAVRITRSRGLRLLATAPRDGRSLYEADLTEPFALMVGGEGAGLPPSLRSLVDQTISIPMRPTVESLNVAVAAALCVYEAGRQRAARRRRPAMRIATRQRRMR